MGVSDGLGLSLGLEGFDFGVVKLLVGNVILGGQGDGAASSARKAARMSLTSFFASVCHSLLVVARLLVNEALAKFEWFRPLK